MDVTFNTLLAHEEYEVRVGNRYEIAEGVWGTMKYPTASLQERVDALSKAEGGYSDFKIAQIVLSGIENVKEEDAIFGLPAKAAQDFFRSVMMIVDALTKISPESLGEAEEPATQ